MKTDNLARAIERDLLAERPRSAPTPTCFACDREHTPKPPDGDDSTRFCSDRCRQRLRRWPTPQCRSAHG